MNVVIAHGGDISFPGGGTNRVLTFAKALAENGYEVSLVVPKPKGKIPELANVKIHTIPIGAKGIKDQILRAMLVSWKAKKLAEKENAILQVEHSTLGGIAASLGCSNYVLDIHEICFEDPMYSRIYLSKMMYWLERKAVKKASKIITVSPPMKSYIINEWRVPEDKVVLIPNGHFADKLSNIEEPEENGLVSFLGVFTHIIDYKKIIKLAKLRKDIRICMIGTGPMRQKFLKMVKENNLNNVLTPGFLPDDEAYKILARSQVCIQPLLEGTTTKVDGHMKILNYAALGKAIATDRDGLATVFEDHKAALVSNPMNPNEFIENSCRLVDDEKLRKKLGSNAKKLVKDFTWEKQKEKLVKLYEDL